MSTRELRRAAVLGRVKSKTLRLTDAAKILELSYRRTKRLWKRYRGEGAKGLQHRSAGAATQGDPGLRSRECVFASGWPPPRGEYCSTLALRYDFTCSAHQKRIRPDSAGLLAISVNVPCVRRLSVGGFRAAVILDVRL